MFGVKEFRVEIDGGALPCIAFGKGDRPLVAIPGLRLSSIEGSGAAAAWYYRIFAKEYRVYMFDKKDPLPEECTVSGMAEDTAQAMKKLGIENADVIGVSLGGMIAQELAIRHPELVGKLVLGMTLSRPNPTAEDAVSAWIGMAEKGDLTGVARDYMSRGYSARYLRRYKRLLPLVLKTQKLMEPERFIRLAGACLTCDTYDRLGAIRCPVFVIGAREDRVVSGQASEELADTLGCERYIYPDLSHEAYNEAPDFNMRIYDFLKR